MNRRKFLQVAVASIAMTTGLAMTRLVPKREQQYITLETGGWVYKKYPVHADGIGDDTAALQAAMNDCAAYGTGIVHLAPGEYRLTETLEITGGDLMGHDSTLLSDAETALHIHNPTSSGVISHIPLRQATLT